MKQFNLDEYLQNPSRPVVTRDGRPVRIICTDANREETPVVALVKDKGTGYEALFPFSKRGKYYASTQESDTDLFFVPTKHVGWTNVYKNSFGQLLLGSNFPYKTEEEARKDSVTNSKYEIYCGTVRLEWEE